jgi:molybdate-binding protein/DNA-binding XRE family transcriptional regulator
MRNQLATVRKRRGIGAAALAQRVGVSRQTIYAIEAGDFVPNTEITLRLARELETSVEELFSLGVEPPAPEETIETVLLASRVVPPGHAARICRVGERMVSVPAMPLPYYLPAVDGVIVKKRGRTGAASILRFREPEADERGLVVAGCDPAVGLLADAVRRGSGVEVVAAGASSRTALGWLRQGLVHIAGLHLEDPASGEFNLPLLRREFPRGEIAVVTFAEWEEGLVVAAGNPRKIRHPEDLARRTVRLRNREAGSGSRALLDRKLREAGVPAAQVSGYGQEAQGHLEAAAAVASGQADCCVATRSAALAFELDFIAWNRERYDFALWKQMLPQPAVQSFLDELSRLALRRKLEAVAGYDTRHTGAVLA